MPPRVGSSAVGAGPARSVSISRNSERRSKRCITVPLRSPCYELSFGVERTLHARSGTFKSEVLFSTRARSESGQPSCFFSIGRAQTIVDALDTGRARRLASIRGHHGLRIRRRARRISQGAPRLAREEPLG